MKRSHPKTLTRCQIMAAIYPVEVATNVRMGLWRTTPRMRLSASAPWFRNRSAILSEIKRLKGGKV